MLHARVVVVRKLFCHPGYCSPKTILSSGAKIFLAYVVIRWPVFRHMSAQRAIGVDDFRLVLSSPTLWILASLFFALFFAVSRVKNKLVTALLFWIPTLMFSTFVVAFVAFLTYVWVRFRP